MRILLLIIFYAISSNGYSQKEIDHIFDNLVDVIESKESDEVNNYAYDTLYAQLESVSHSDKVKLENSLRFYADSISIETNILLSCLYNIRTSIYNQSNIPEQHKYSLIEELISEYNANVKLNSSDSSFIKSLYNFKGKSLFRLGYLKKALRSYTMSITFSEENTIRNIEPTIPIKLRLRQLNNLENDIEDLINQFIKNDQVLYIGKSQFYLIDYYLLTNQFDQAKDHLSKINKKYQHIYPGIYFKKVADTYKKLGEIGLEEEALKNQLIAVELDSLRYPNSLHQDLDLAKFYLQNNKIELSSIFFKKVLENNIIGKKEDQNFIDIGIYINTLIGLSEISFMRGSTMGLDLLNDSYELIKTKFKNLQFQEDKLILTENYKKIISLKIRYRELLNISNEELFNLAEESKAIALLDELVLNKTIESTLKPDDYDNWITLKEKIFATEENIKKLSNKESEYPKLKRLINSRKQFVNEQEKLFEDYDIKAIDNSKLTNSFKLKQNQQVLEYFVFDTTALLIAKTNDNTNVFELKLDSKTQQGIIKVKDLILKKKSKQLLDSLSNSISNILLPPELNLKEELIIIPDGILSYIPFECLLTKKRKYLIEDKNISYSYSMNILNMMSEKNIETNMTLACSPKYSSAINNYPLVALTNNFDESKYIASLSSNSIHLKDKGASKENFLKHIQNTKVLHFAGHADINAFDIDKSYLAFSDHTGQVDSTMLFLNELYNLKLSTDLIVLSACNTGMGSLIEGEGILSLARGFIYAGTKSVVSSLWKADDQSTKDLMIDFYNFLSEGYSKDKAIGLAKRKYLKENGGAKLHPYYWAGFVLIGDTSPICSSYSNWFFYSLILFGLFIVILYFFRKKRASA